MIARRISNLRQLYWRVRRKPAIAWHVGAVLMSFALAYARLLVEKKLDRSGRPVVAIALVEHLGDIMAAEPIARFARGLYPRARILWVVKNPYRDLAAAYPQVDRAVAVTCLTDWILLKDTGLVDHVIDLHLHTRVCPSCEIELANRREPRTLTVDDFYYFGNLLETQCYNAGLPILSDAPSLALPRGLARKIDTLGLESPFIVIHCRANDRQRNWVAEKWESVIDGLTGITKAGIVEIGLSAMIAPRVAPTVTDLCGKLSILESAEVIRRATLFLGVDSGPAHLANAVGTYAIILMGKFRHFERYMPYSGDFESGGRGKLLYAHGKLENLSVEEVMGTLNIILREKGLTNGPH